MEKLINFFLIEVFMAKEHKVLLYRTSTCIWCHRAEEFFNQKKVKFESIWVDKDHKMAQEMVKKSGQLGVPVIDIDGKIIIGFDLESIKKALEIK